MSVETITPSPSRQANALPLAKRAFDIAFSGTALLLLSPALFVIAIAIKLGDGGPVLFWQKRVGKDGVEFDFPKFRSMVCNAEALRRKIEEQNHHGAAAVTFKMKNDPRITPVGRLLRKFSLDELPQFWCVLKGDMSLVGPRPALTTEVARYSASDRRRLGAVPGLTCYWQVMGRGDIPFAQQVELDVRYIEEQNFWLDIALLLKTIPAVLFGKGAY